MKLSLRSCMAIAALAQLAWAGSSPAAQSPPVPDVGRLEAMAARLAPVDIRTDLAALPENERAALRLLVEAGNRIDGIYLRQSAPLTAAQLVTLAADTSTLGVARFRYFLLNKGPWSELDEDAPFLPG